MSTLFKYLLAVSILAVSSLGLADGREGHEMKGEMKGEMKSSMDDSADSAGRRSQESPEMVH